MIPSDLPKRYEPIFNELKDLALETFGLWEQNRVGLRWKDYLANHSQRVTSLGVELGKRADGNCVALAFAGILHDITKPYDGDYLKDADSVRVVGKEGYWKNEILYPARQNLVTHLYDKHDLYGKVHNISGAIIARDLLERYDLKESLIEEVCAMIRAHIQPLHDSAKELDRYNKLENRIIADADLIDSNFGYVSFFRHMNIHGYQMKQRNAFDIDEHFADIGQWIEWKRKFVSRLFLDFSRKIAEKRLERTQRLYEVLKEEMNRRELNEKYGLLGMMQYFLHRTEDPNFTEEVTSLRNQWIPTRQKWISGGPAFDPELAQQSLTRVIQFVKTTEEEAKGRA